MSTATTRLSLHVALSLSIALGAFVASQASADPPAGDAAAAPIAAPTDGAAGSAPTEAGATSEATKALWTKHCASCHGAEGKADTKTAALLKIENLTDPQVRAGFDRARMIESTKNGVKKEGSDKLAMKGFAEKLSDAEIAALVDHVYSLGE